MKDFSLIDDSTGINCGVDKNGMLFFDNARDGYKYKIRNTKTNRSKLLKKFNNLTACERPKNINLCSFTQVE